MSNSASLLRARAERIFHRLEESELVILVWGSSPSDERNYKKRLDIREELIKKFPRTSVHFSEDTELREHTAGKFRDLADEERVHARLADLIFALDTSKGVGEEIARFSAFPDVCIKMVVLTHKKYSSVSSFASEVRRFLVIERYTDEDFESCRLAKELCIKHVYSYALQRHLSEA